LNRNANGQNRRKRDIFAYWLPEFTLKRNIAGTVYSVSGSYDGTERLDRKLSRIFVQQDLGDRHDISHGR